MTLPEKKQQSADARKLAAPVRLVPADRKAIAEKLAKELSFMSMTLEDLKAEIQERGPIDLFKQGSQEFFRESPALKAYNTTIQRYSLLWKQLEGLLPKQVQDNANSPLFDFLNEA